MPEWLVEQGIGEERAILVEDGAIVAAKIHWPGQLLAGQVESARLTSRVAGSKRGTARFASGEEALVTNLPRDASEGSDILLQVTRSATGETGRQKLAQARPTDRAPVPGYSLADSLADAGQTARVVYRFPIVGWEELLGEAMSQTVTFAGGQLHLYPAPAMTLVDIDGTLRPRDLALAAIPAIAEALARLDIGGSIGIDFPTLHEKADRRAVDEALGAALNHWPHERTAMNGFGFVQLVARLEGPSILHRVTQDRAGASARLLLRSAEGIAAPGTILLTCHPAVTACLRDELLEELGRRTGRKIRVETNRALALEGSFAQAVDS